MNISMFKEWRKKGVLMKERLCNIKIAQKIRRKICI
jgi:hypothetical protein